jgi:DtxR family Mn-dependent transcriptional regulator
MDPLLSLITGIAIIALLIAIFYPGKGILAYRRKANVSKERVLIEDTLKFLFDNEYKGLVSSLKALAGTLNITLDKAAELILRLESLGLITTGAKNQLNLTEEGRSYALRVIRIHRIWERYLADETSVDEKKWHTDADQIEHKMSLSDADELASKLGHPVVDPHGDPIPSASGELPDYEGQSLNQLDQGDIARILHIEDEPETIYRQILAMGIYPGMEIRVIENSAERVRFECEGEDLVLAPVFAENITVQEKKLEKLTIDQENAKTLNQLERGQKARVLAISPACRKQQKRRLMDLGIVPGSEIEVALESAGKNPRAYRILDTLIALRELHASFIFVEPINVSSHVQ